MALLSALQCPLIGSKKRSVSAATKTVSREYKSFCQAYYDVVVDGEAWKEEGTFVLKCFASRSSVSYLIIAAYQGLCKDGCYDVRAGFASEVKQETWNSIARSLLVSLGVASEKVTQLAAEQLGKELLLLLQSKQGRLEAYLLSLLQAKQASLAPKDKIRGQKRNQSPGRNEGGSLPKAPIKKARSSKEQSSKSVASNITQKEARDPAEFQANKGAVPQAVGGRESDGPETDEEEIEAEPDFRKRSDLPSESPIAKQSETVAAGDVGMLQPDETKHGEVRTTMETHVPSTSPTAPLARDRPPAGGYCLPTDVVPPRGSTRTSPAFVGGGQEKRAPSQSQVPSSPDLSRSSPEPMRAASLSPTRKIPAGLAPERRPHPRKELLAQMSPNSKKQLTKKTCSACNLKYALRLQKCPNPACGEEAENKAAAKRAVAKEKKLAKRIPFKKAWDNLTLAAQVLENSKPNGAHVGILSLKNGEVIDSVSTFGLNGGHRFVTNVKIQEAFTSAVTQKVNEDRKAARKAEKEREMVSKAAEADFEKEKEKEVASKAAEAVKSAGTCGASGNGTVDGESAAGPHGGASNTLQSIVDGLARLDESDKVEILECFKREKFTLEDAKETSAIEFRSLLPNVSFPQLKALVKGLQLAQN